MAQIYLPPMVGFCDPFANVEFGPGEVVEIIVPRGYLWRPVTGGILIRKTWWRQVLDRLLFRS